MKFMNFLRFSSQLKEQGFEMTDVVVWLSDQGELAIPKLISNDLTRFTREGLLDRRRVKRVVLGKNAKLCYSGFRYQYKLSKKTVKFLRDIVRNYARSSRRSSR